MKKINVSFLLFLSGCLPVQQVSHPDISTRYINATTETCGANDFSNATKKNVLKLHECLAYFQESILLPDYPYPDLFKQTISQRGLLAEKFHQGKISKQEFLAYDAQIISNRNTESMSRDYMQPQYQPIHLDPIVVPKTTHCSSYMLGNTLRTNCY